MNRELAPALRACTAPRLEPDGVRACGCRYEHIREEHTTQINTIHAAIARIPAPVPPPEPHIDPGPRFTWSENLAAGVPVPAHKPHSTSRGPTPRR